MSLLIEAGYTYTGNGLADDIPHYWVADFANRRAILTLPYYYHFDDQFFLMFPQEGYRPGASGYPIQELEDRVRRAIQARTGGDNPARGGQ